MSLIEQIYLATQSGELPQQFTTENLKEWIECKGIIKDDGSDYAESSINSILSNSDTANSPTTNKNTKILKSSISLSGKKEYWF